MKSHGDKIATTYSFYEVLTKNSTDLAHLRHSCLDPGLYYKHTKTWLRYFQPRQLLFLDGQLLRSRPHRVLDQVERFVLDHEPSRRVNFRRMLVFDKKKGFYCVRRPSNETRTRICLGASKGRHYPTLDTESYKLLSQFYAESNTKFARLLRVKFPNSEPLSWLLNQTTNPKT